MNKLIVLIIPLIFTLSCSNNSINFNNIETNLYFQNDNYFYGKEYNLLNIDKDNNNQIVLKAKFKNMIFLNRIKRVNADWDYYLIEYNQTEAITGKWTDRELRFICQVYGGQNGIRDKFIPPPFVTNKYLFFDVIKINNKYNIVGLYFPKYYNIINYLEK